MANEEHIKRLLEGPEVWNEWFSREQRRLRFFRPDLSGIDVRKIFQDAGKIGENTRPDLSNYMFQFANFQYAYIDSTILNNAHFQNADFRGANIYHSTMKSAGLFRADFRNAKAWGVDFTQAELGRAKFEGATFEFCIFDQSSLSETDLSNVDFSSSRIWRSCLYENPQRFQLCNQNASQTRPSFRISSVKDLMTLRQCLSNIDPHLDTYALTRIYYRGENSGSWELRPYLFRSPEDFADPPTYELEAKLLTQLISSEPSSFAGLSSSFEELVVGAHYGLPTRLLDITRNPLVALYFACQENEDETDGKLHVFIAPEGLIRPFNSDTVSVIANFTKLSRPEQNWMLTKSVYDTEQDVDPIETHDIHLNRYGYRNIVARLNHFIAQEKPYFEPRIDPRDLFRVLVVEPKLSFDRLRAQSAAFLISAWHERFEETEIKSVNPDIPVYAHYVALIPNECKPRLRRELEWLNITEASLFPGLDTATKEIRQRLLGS